MILPSETKMLIIGGTGGTGSWFARYFKGCGFQVSVWGPGGKVEVAEKMNVQFASDLNESVKESDVVLLSVPIKKTVEVIRDVAPKMRPGSLLMDVTSLKSEPMETMMKYAASGVEVLGTHPMFGPTMPTIKGQTVILVPGPKKCEKWLSIMEAMFRRDGAQVEVLDAEKHDEIMAVVQALTHFAYISVGAALNSLDFDVAHSRRFMSPVYEIMIDFVGRILAQSPELYANIQENPKAKMVRDAYIEECVKLAKRADEGDAEGFMEIMKDAAEHFQERDQALVRSDRLIKLWIENRVEDV